MRISITFLLVFLFSLSYGHSSIKPADLVRDARDGGKAFERVELFSAAQQKAKQLPEDAELIKEYSVLDLQNESLQNLLLSSPAQISFVVPRHAKSALEVELVRVEVVTDDFQLLENGALFTGETQHGLHYRGIIKGEETSMAAISVFGDEVMGLFSSDQHGNLVLGKLDGNNWKTSEHILYNDKELLASQPFDCGTMDDGVGYTREELEFNGEEKDVGDCVRVFFEVDYDIYQGKGGVSGASNYITGLYNQVATLYANESINTAISTINVISSSGQAYSNQSSSGMLNQFQSRYSGFNGDLAQMVSYKSSGGIAAGFSGICNGNPDNSMCFSNITSSYSTVPTYSWSVMVTTHELGHLWGSRHTHACVWNGNNTAIDGCAGATEGSCSLPGYPSNGGTIMSYCHLQSVGINFNEGFGPQPGNVIRNSVANANCLSASCSGGGGGSCTDNEITLTINLDNYPGETTWEITNSGGSVVASGGPYSGAGSTVNEDICLVDGCYEFTIFDSYGDGICCGYGNGSYSLNDGGTVLASGGNFGSSESTDFCLNDSPGGGGGDCVEINFNNYTISSYGSGQDNGTYTVQSSGNQLYIGGNAWKSINLNYTVTSNTVIELDFGSTSQGEIHGIGFDSDNGISSNRTFQFFGTQNWGISNYQDYAGSFGYWKSYTIPVGQFYTGSFNRLFFVADHDGGSQNGNSYFKSIKIYEGSSCNTGLPAPPADGTTIMQNQAEGAFALYPNPAQDELNINFSSVTNEDAMIRIFSVTGQMVHQVKTSQTEGYNEHRLDISNLPQGSYMIRVEGGDTQYTERFTITR